MKRPLLFALECVLAMAIAVFGAWLAAKAGHKMNAKANGDIRAAAAQERIATALERAYPRQPCSKALAQEQHEYSLSHPYVIVPVCDPW